MIKELQALEKIKNLYKAGENNSLENEFNILEKRFKKDLEITAIKWIKNFYDCNRSSREVFTYLESKL